MERNDTFNIVPSATTTLPPRSSEYLDPPLDISSEKSSTISTQEYTSDLDTSSNLPPAKRSRTASEKTSTNHLQFLQPPPSKEPKERLERLHWDYTMEEVLFTRLVDMDRAGKRADSGWKSEAWGEILSAVLVVTPDRQKDLLTMDKLKSKESNYKALYKDWKWLTTQSGFGIHPETRVVTASNEAWDEVLKVSKQNICTFYSEDKLIN
jgi:hypothetical protein